MNNPQDEDILIIGKAKLGKTITPPQSEDPEIERILHDYTIKRERVADYIPRGDCSSCMANYKAAKKLNRKGERTVLLVKRIPIDPIGDIIGIEVFK